MTTYLEMAKSPLAFDTELARLHGEAEAAQRAVTTVNDKIHRNAGDHRVSTRHGLGWKRTHAEVMREATPALKDELTAALTHQAQVATEIDAMNRVYASLSKPWIRFFPSVTKSHPHIHRSLRCHTLHATTVMTWQPALSGHTYDEAVAELDEALCSVCFPDAPVALHEYVSRKSQAEQQARQAEKDARDAAKAAKTLTDDEQFRTVGTFQYRVTTVAKCKELVRELPKAEVELEWTREHAARVWGLPANSEQVLRLISNREDKVREARVNSDHAQTVLIARELEHPGWGADAVAIGKMVDTARKNAAKEWAKN